MRRARPMPPIEVISAIKERLSYDEDTGEIQWLKLSKYRKTHSTLAGSVACVGSKTDGSDEIVINISIYVNRKLYTYSAKTVAYLLKTGTWPKYNIRNVNGNPLDNSWSNLELLDPKNVIYTDTSGIKKYYGVTTLIRGGYRAFYKDPQTRKDIHLGCYKTAEEASAVFQQYIAAKDIFKD